MDRVVRRASEVAELHGRKPCRVAPTSAKAGCGLWIGLGAIQAMTQRTRQARIVAGRRDHTLPVCH
jgi:hypothetical protein